MNVAWSELAPLFAIAGVLFTGVICFAVWLYRWQYRTADARLQRWSQQFHYTLLDKQRANPFGTGPAARSGNKQVMYHVTVADVNGTRRHALVKIGSQTTGVLTDDLVVEWE